MFSAKSPYLQVSTKVTMVDILPSTKAALSFRIPDHKSGKVSDFTPIVKRDAYAAYNCKKCI